MNTSIDKTLTSYIVCKDICPQHNKKAGVLDRFFVEAFTYLSRKDLASFSLTSKITRVYCDYLKSLTEPELEKFVNMTTLSALNRCLGGNHISIAQKIAKLIYESPMRDISNFKYGKSFAMNPELLSYVAYLARGENVLEIAGAKGENALLLAFSAKHVFMNDICHVEIEEFKKLCSTLPQEVANKLTSIEGDCFDILKEHPEIERTIGIILCQNLIHFFNDEIQEQLMTLVKRCLKPEGKAIFVVNAVYASSPLHSAYLEFPDQTSFNLINCIVDDYRIQSQHAIYQKVSPCDPKKISTDYKIHRLYTKTAEQTTMQELPNAYEQIDDLSVREGIKDSIKKNSKRINDIPKGSIRILESTSRSYSEKTLERLFVKHGFTVNTSFLMDPKGHLFHQEDCVSKVLKVGVIVTNKQLA